MKINNKENDYFNCYKKHTLTHLSLVISSSLYLIYPLQQSLYSYCYHTNTFIQVLNSTEDTFVVKCIFCSSLIVLLFSAFIHSREPRPLLTATWIYLHDFPTFTDETYTCYALRKTQCLKCIKQHKYIHCLSLSGSI